MDLWEKCVDFHGHSCGGLRIGYAAAEYAILPDLLHGNETLDTAADSEAALTLLLMPSDSLGHGFSPLYIVSGFSHRNGLNKYAY